MAVVKVPDRLLARARERKRKLRELGLSPSLFDCAAEIQAEEKLRNSLGGLLVPNKVKDDKKGGLGFGLNLR